MTIHDHVCRYLFTIIVTIVIKPTTIHDMTIPKSWYQNILFFVPSPKKLATKHLGKLKTNPPKNKFSPWKGAIIRTKPSLDGGNSNIFCFHPEPWGRWLPVWRAYFSKGLVQPPTSSFFRSQNCAFSRGVFWQPAPPSLPMNFGAFRKCSPSGFVLHVWARKLCIFHKRVAVGEKTWVFLSSQVVGANDGNEIYV